MSERIISEQIFHDIFLERAESLISNQAIRFYPSIQTDLGLPYVYVDCNRAVRLLTDYTFFPIQGLEIDQQILVEAAEMTESVLRQIGCPLLHTIKYRSNPEVYHHECLADDSIILGNRVEHDASLLQQQLGVDGQTKEYKICAAVLGIGHEVGHQLARSPNMERKLSIVEDEPVVKAYTEWFMFSGNFSSVYLHREQFATGVGYLIASIAAQKMHLIRDWEVMTDRLTGIDKQILQQFSCFVNFLKNNSGNPFSLSNGLLQLKNWLQQTHPDLVVRVPQLSPYYIGYYSSINPRQISSYFEN